MPTQISRVLSLSAALLALSFAPPHAAQAHAYPVHQSPAAGDTVASAPARVDIDFDEGLEPAFSNITVDDGQGRSVTQGKASVDPANAKHMSVTLKPLQPGVYKVSWVAVATDGHRTQGHYPFTVKSAAP